jgi:hypothetical protein
MASKNIISAFTEGTNRYIATISINSRKSRLKDFRASIFFDGKTLIKYRLDTIKIRAVATIQT